MFEKNLGKILAKEDKIHYYNNCVSTREYRVLIKNITYNLGRFIFMLKPLGDRIVIELVQSEERTASGIVLPDSAKEKPQEGKVVAVGSGRVLDSGERVALEVAVGDGVIFSKYAGTELKYEDKEYLILKETDVLAVVGK